MANFAIGQSAHAIHCNEDGFKAVIERHMVIMKHSEADLFPRQGPLVAACYLKGDYHEFRAGR